MMALTMSESAIDGFNALKKRERHRSLSETLYWFGQYKLRARQQAEEIDALRAKLRDLTEWRDMGSAPKDGKKILVVYCDEDGRNRPCVAFWDVVEWSTDSYTFCHPTGWLPLPETPKEG